ncbi:helix-turn-helix domain-containing protein [Bacillus altitudinis]|uniref:PucR family transcriptional regulator n=1 Tax=Bacillus altitudinis TaxID=293387 RepID=UPI0009665D0E|nr:helix-turn-helix domain-containing protein [Bacillus altitudinis]SIT67004.1 transcriptional regulator, PucR family [Bacillus altitudinis]
MNIVDHHVEVLQKVAQRIHQPVYLINQYGRILFTSPQGMTNPDWIQMLRLFHSTQQHYFSMVHSKESVSVFPIYINEQAYDYLVVPAFIHPQDDMGLHLIIEQAVHAMSISRIKQHAIKQSTERAKNEWFRKWMEGTISSEQDVACLARMFGLNTTIPYLCIVCQLDQSSHFSCFLKQQTLVDDVFALLESTLSHCPFPAFLFVKGDIGIFLIEETGGWLAMNKSICSFLKQMQILIKQHVNATISFGVSLSGYLIIDLPKGFSEAAHALQSGQLSLRTEYIQFYQAKDVSDLLKLIPPKDLTTFYERYLHPLYEQSQVDPNLLHTLSVYVETHCHISETAKRLSVHRNTVIYRLEKCEELLQISLKDPDATLRLRLALRIQKHLSSDSN